MSPQLSGFYNDNSILTGGAIDDTMKLGDLGVGPNGTIQLEMQSVDPVNTPIKRFKPRQEYHMPDVITVRVPAGQTWKILSSDLLPWLSTMLMLLTTIHCFDYRGRRL